MCADMVAEDYRAARRQAVLRDYGLDLPMALQG
jgi:GDPmannose 4,6-dehydratase